MHVPVAQELAQINALDRKPPFKIANDLKRYEIPRFV